jgi:hypothetical protein
MAQYFNPTWARGRVIKDVKMNGWKDDAGQQHYAPVFVLDNGAEIGFMVTEQNQGGEYGVQPLYWKGLAPKVTGP